MYRRELKTTEDGSTTFFWPDKNEHFHSTHGAIQESRHIFIEAGLLEMAKYKKEIRVLEIGFGTGLNALLSCIAAEKLALKVDYQTIEAFPINAEEHKLLNYPDLLGVTSKPMYDSIFNAIWEKPEQIVKGFTLLKKLVDLELFIPESECFDIIYFDAFAPDVQPELWTDEIFQKLYNSLKTNGFLITYSCKGVVKRALKSVGFQVELLPGPPGKREFVKAIKISI
jgi:tRNA U34 5-methylaminomethyl-2-thiouridine-forming methyltransferase MnmC